MIYFWNIVDEQNQTIRYLVTQLPHTYHLSRHCYHVKQIEFICPPIKILLTYTKVWLIG